MKICQRNQGLVQNVVGAAYCSQIENGADCSNELGDLGTAADKEKTRLVKVTIMDCCGHCNC